MLSIFAVLAFLSAAVLLATYLVRQAKKPVNKINAAEFPPLNARPLFEPTSEELRQAEQESRLLEAEVAAAERERTTDRSATELEARITAFAAEPMRASAIDLIRLAAEHGNATLFSRAASEVIKVFRKGLLQALAAGDVAALIDSHYRLLPAGARSSGELFWLKKDLADLARKI
jgi:hypothetical protein